MVKRTIMPLPWHPWEIINVKLEAALLHSGSSQRLGSPTLTEDYWLSHGR